MIVTRAVDVGRTRLRDDRGGLSRQPAVQPATGHDECEQHQSRYAHAEHESAARGPDIGDHGFSRSADATANTSKRRSTLSLSAPRRERMPKERRIEPVTMIGQS